jgi:general stress protein 26
MDQCNDRIVKFLNENKTALFTTITEDNYFDSRMIGPFVNDRLIVYVFTLGESNKTLQIGKNSHVSLYLQNVYKNIKEYKSLLINGTASNVVSEEETMKVIDMLEIRSRNYKEWIDKDGWGKWTIIKICPERIKFIDNSESKTPLIFTINDNL